MRRLTFLEKPVQQSQTTMHLSPSSRIIMRIKRQGRRQILILISGRILLLLCLLVTWQLVSGRLVDPLFISSPLAIARQLWAWTLDGTLWFHSAITLEEIALGLSFGIMSGVLLGFFLGIEQPLAELFDPLIATIYSIPKIALAPLFILWFGIDLQMKVIFAAATVFFLVFYNTLAGVRNVNQDLVDAVRLMGGQRRDILLKVIVPATTGHVLTGIYIAVPYALIGAVIGELIASNRGIGYLIESSASSFNTAGVFAALVVLTAIAGGLNAVVKCVDQKTSRWKVNISLRRKIVP